MKLFFTAEKLYFGKIVKLICSFLDQVLICMVQDPTLPEILKMLPSTPCDCVFKYIDYFTTSINGRDVYTFFVKCSEYQAIPLEANVRLPNRDASPYKEMQSTLKLEPGAFFYKNTGINVIASELKVNKSKKSATLKIPGGYGVLNGGHTQQAIIDYQYHEMIDPQAIARIEVIVWKDISKNEIANLAKAKNSSSNVKGYSLAEKSGYFENLKKFLDPVYEKHIQWKENEDVDGEVFGAVDLIALLSLFDISNYPNEDTVPNSVTATGATFNKWVESCRDGNDRLKNVEPLANDILELYEYILSTFNKDIERGFTNLKVINAPKSDKSKKTIFHNLPIEYILPKQIVYPLLGAFRADLHEVNGQYEWINNPIELFDRTKKQLMKQIQIFLNNNPDINRMSKDTTIWVNLYQRIKLTLRES